VNELTGEVRRDLGLTAYDRLDPMPLASALDIPVMKLSDFILAAPTVQHLLESEPALSRPSQCLQAIGEPSSITTPTRRHANAATCLANYHTPCTTRRRRP
jgi:hypothetical protein